MLKNYNLEFKSGSILTGELLHKMYALPTETSRLLFIDYSDGVISGLHFYEKDNELFLSKGIYKHKGYLYLLENDTKIELAQGSFKTFDHYIIYFENINNVKESENIELNSLNLIVRKNDKFITELEKEKAICHFQFDGFKLPLRDDDITSCNFNLISFKHSIYGNEPTFRPELFKIIYDKLFVNYLSKYNNLHPLDYIFIQEVNSKGVVSCEFMRQYIKVAKNVEKVDDHDRESLMKNFIDAVKALKRSNGSPSETRKPIPKPKNQSPIIIG